jgi:hypothetical protein
VCQAIQCSKDDFMKVPSEKHQIVNDNLHNVSSHTASFAATPIL